MHTPGPWSIRKYERQPEATWLIETDTVMIAEVHNWVSSEANARLIATAPDLLEALEKIAYGEIQKVIGDKPMRYSHATVKELRALAKQAISRATKKP